MGWVGAFYPPYIANWRAACLWKNLSFQEEAEEAVGSDLCLVQVVEEEGEEGEEEELGSDL